jgi:CHAP domain
MALRHQLTVGASLVLTVAATASAAPAVATAGTPLAVKIAQGELKRGVREIPMGSNRGKRIKMYEDAALPAARQYPAPWCAYFVSWVTREAERPIGRDGSGFANVDALHMWAVKTKRWTHHARPGRLIVFDEHVGIVNTVHGRSLTSIEGNASNRVSLVARHESDAEGYVVLPPRQGLAVEGLGPELETHVFAESGAAYGLATLPPAPDPGE